MVWIKDKMECVDKLLWLYREFDVDGLLEIVNKVIEEYNEIEDMIEEEELEYLGLENDKMMMMYIRDILMKYEVVEWEDFERIVRVVENKVNYLFF